MRFLRTASVVTAMLCGVLSYYPGQSFAEEKGKAVPVVVSWQGKVKPELQKEAPETGYITDRKAWEKLWKAWRGTEQVPSVNFKEAIILIAVIADPNRIAVLPTIDDRGDLRLFHEYTPMRVREPPETYFYQIALISRAGIKTIGRKEIEKD